MEISDFAEKKKKTHKPAEQKDGTAINPLIVLVQFFSTLVFVSFFS